MNARYFRPLEFDKIRARLAAHASFGASEELARALTPSTDLGEIKTRQQETTEARALLDQQPGVGLGGARDVRPSAAAARLGALLAPTDFLDIRATLLSARTLRRHLTRLEAVYPRLAFLAGGLEELPGLVDAITRVVNDRGEVMDSASPDLERIRRELNVLRGRVTERLQRMLGSSEFARYLQEPIITQREGRYVIPIRAEARGRVKGIVHDTSASGATLFVEPLAIVEMDNRVRELQIQETREVERILRELTGRVAENAEALDRTVETLAELDLAFAKARYSGEIRGVEPKMVGAGPEARPDRGSPLPLQLVQARHPLLDPEKVVPISIELGRAFTVLIITGPNTGGKTVALKTVGLLALMAQSGLHLPAAEGTTLPVYDGVFADIGDEQSIEQNLSTFSAHMTNLVEILREATPHSLVLLDELGAGTDPVEGSALARAIITNLLGRKISALIATHYAELKAFAHTVPGVENASVEFDVETLAPTYHLTIGLPGRSNAFAIAKRLGLDPALVEQARASLPRTDAELEKLLAEIKHTREETARELSRAAAERESAERAAAGARRQLAEIERGRREILERARAEAQSELEAARVELNRLRQQWRQAAVPREVVERAEEDLATVQELTHLEAERPAPAPPPPAGESVAVGDQVEVPSLEQTGVVTAQDEDGVEVQIGAFRVRLAPDQVRLRAKHAAAQPTASGPVSLPAAESPGLELHLRGMRADAALDELDRYLDRAYLAGLPYVRIVHGKGTGTLRRLVRERLAETPFVVSFHTAEANEGGEGVTVASLAGR